MLRDEDGDNSIVVPAADTPVVEAVLEAVCQVHGDQFQPDNPVIIEAAKGLKVECWHSCTKAWKEAENVEDYDSYNDWWAPHGDGKRSIYVVAIERSLYVIGDEAEAWVEATVEPA